MCIIYDLFITFDFFVANDWPEHCREIGFRFCFVDFL